MKYLRFVCLLRTLAFYILIVFVVQQKTSAKEPILYSLNTSNPFNHPTHLLKKILPAPPDTKAKLAERALKKLEAQLADSLAKYGAKHPSNGIIANKIAAIYNKKKEFSLALHFYQQALQAFIPPFKENNIVKNPKPEQLVPIFELLETLENKAITLYEWSLQENDIKSMENALVCFQLYSKQIDLLRRAESFNKKHYTLADIAKVNENNTLEIALKVAYLLYKKKENDRKYLEIAFGFMEKKKAIDLLQGIEKTEPQIEDKVPIRTLAAEGTLKKKVVETEWLWWDAIEMGKDTATHIEDSLLILRREEDKLIEKLQKEHPDYYHLKAHIKVAEVKDIQSRLEQGEALITYFLGTTETYVFFITQKDIKVYQWARDDGLEALIADLRESMSDEEFIRQDREQAFKNYTNSAYEVYQKLLAKILNKQKLKHLTIIPDGCLFHLPFETLLTTKEHIDSTDYRRLVKDYLLYQYPISYSYSATLWLYENKGQTKPKNVSSYVGLLPFYEEKSLFENRNQANSNDLKRNFEQLENGRMEVEAMHQFLGGSKKASSIATKEDFGEVAKSHQILHLVTQGILEEQAEVSKLLFTPSDSTLEGNGYLHAYELPGIPINAELTVLSITNLDSKKLLQKRGLISFIKGFVYAGCPSVMMNLWNTEQTTKLQIMTYFFEALQNKKSKDVALQTAKIRFLKENADRVTANPFYWGNFVQYGNPKPVVVKSGFNISKYLSWIGGSIAFLGIIWSVWYRQVVVNRR